MVGPLVFKGWFGTLKGFQDPLKGSQIKTIFRTKVKILFIIFTPFSHKYTLEFSRGDMIYYITRDWI